MSERDEAIHRAMQLITRCDTATVVRVADELEDSLEPGPCATMPRPETDGQMRRMIDALCAVYD